LVFENAQKIRQSLVTLATGTDATMQGAKKRREQRERQVDRNSMQLLCGLPNALTIDNILDFGSQDLVHR
jgi:hypothetical protein